MAANYKYSQFKTYIPRGMLNTGPYTQKLCKGNPMKGYAEYRNPPRNISGNPKKGYGWM